jgi:hypothetical protein
MAICLDLRGRLKAIARSPPQLFDPLPAFGFGTFCEVEGLAVAVDCAVIGNGIALITVAVLKDEQSEASDVSEEVNFSWEHGCNGAVFVSSTKPVAVLIRLPLQL